MDEAQREGRVRARARDQVFLQGETEREGSAIEVEWE